MIAITLTLFPIVYLLLLFFLSSSQVEPAPDPALDTFLPIMIAIVALTDFALAFFVFLPKVDATVVQNAIKENAKKAFSYLLIAFVLLEAIAIFGLLIGILQIFVTGNFNLPIPALFIGISFLLCLYVYMTYVPKVVLMFNQVIQM